MRTLQMLVGWLTIILFFTSCNSYRKLVYLREVPITDSAGLIRGNKPEYKLQPTDLLYVRIITQNEQMNILFNPDFQDRTSTGQNDQNTYLKNYPVDDSGYINLPVIKKVKVAGLTVPEAQQLLQETALIYLADVQVTLKLANFRFAILGEVKIPGVKNVFDEEVTLLEALAYGGDITYNGNRQEILIIRRTADGSKTYRIDATGGSLIGDRQFYIQPNDIIYVQPLRSTLFRERASDYLFVVTTLTSTISMVVLILTFLNK